MKNTEITEIQLTEHKVVDNEEIAMGVYILTFERPFDFIPGQVVQLTTALTIPPRMYSICSSKNDRLLKILYIVKLQGILTYHLALLSKGDTVYLSTPTGSFAPKLKNSWWIASGTGIAPYISTILSGDVENIHLVHGARTLEGFYFSDLLENRLNSNYIRCCSKELDPKVYPGRLSEYLKEHQNLPSDQIFYLCGSTEMVVDTRDLLINKGINFSKIESEIYF